MSTAVIILMCFAIFSSVALSVLVMLQLRRIRLVEATNNIENFTILLPQRYVLLGFLGFCITIAMLTTFSIQQVIGVYIQVILGIFAVLLLLFIFGSCLYRISVSNGEVCKQTIFSTNKLNLADITQKKSLSFGYCTQYFAEDKLALVINQDCIGAEFMQNLTQKLSEKE